MIGKLALHICAAAALSAAGCASVSQSIPVSFPVLVGPIDHIGGPPVTPVVDPTTPSVPLSNENEVAVCLSTFAPVVFVTRPSIEEMPSRLRRSFAALAGTTALKEHVVRADHLGVGAWEMLGFGCWGRSAWWQNDGHLVRVSR